MVNRENRMKRYIYINGLSYDREYTRVAGDMIDRSASGGRGIFYAGEVLGASSAMMSAFGLDKIQLDTHCRRTVCFKRRRLFACGNMVREIV